MGGWSWLCCGRSNAGGAAVRLPEPFHLPAPLPEWPQGLGLPLSLSPPLPAALLRPFSFTVRADSLCNQLLRVGLGSVSWLTCS